MRKTCVLDQVKLKVQCCKITCLKFKFKEEGVNFLSDNLLNETKQRQKKCDSAELQRWYILILAYL